MKGRKLPVGYLTRKQARTMLGVTRSAFENWVRHGVLVPKTFAGLRGEAYSAHDVDSLRILSSNKNEDLWQLRAQTFQALAQIRTLERRMGEIYDHLQIDVHPLDCSPAGIQSLVRQMEAGFTDGDARNPLWVRSWACCLFGVNAAYLSLAQSVLGDEEPWRRYLQFHRDIGRYALQNLGAELHTPDLHRAYVYFEAAGRHLEYLAYVQSRGASANETVLEPLPTAVEELSAFFDR